MINTLHGCRHLLVVSWCTDRRRLIVALLLMLLQATALPFLAIALGALTDALAGGDIDRALTSTGVIAVLAVAALTAGHFAHVAYFELGELNVLTLDQQLVDVSNGVAGFGHHEDPRYADKLQTLGAEIQRAGWTSIEALLSGISLAIGFSITGILLGMVNPWLLLLPFAALPPLLWGRSAEDNLARSRLATAQHTRKAQHLLRLATNPSSAMEIRICGLRDTILQRHDEAWKAVTAGQWRAERRAILLRIAGQVMFGVAYGAAILLVIWEAAAARRTAGDVVLAITLCAQVNAQVSNAVQLVQELNRFAQVTLMFEELRRVTDDPADRASSAGAPERLVDGIGLHSVSFGYHAGARPVLDKVDLWLPAGSVVAIVGENGTGKSTLAKLLCRLYEPDGGVISVDGTNLRSIPSVVWQERVSAAFQDAARFQFEVRETVGVGYLPNIDSVPAVTSALDRADAATLVDRLPFGLSTRLGKSLPGGRELSGGQWQKLSLARAVMRPEPLVLILDEPTSALDARAEHDLFQRQISSARAAGAKSGAITVLVSHRFSSVRAADLIVVMDQHGIAQRGTHGQLIQAGGLYAELYLMQAEQYS